MASSLNIDTTDYNKVSTLTLEGVEYKFHLYWNSRSGWYFSLYNSDDYGDSLSESDDAMIIGGRKIIPYQNLFETVNSDDLPTDGFFNMYRYNR